MWKTSILLRNWLSILTRLPLMMNCLLHISGGEISTKSSLEWKLRYHSGVISVNSFMKNKIKKHLTSRNSQIPSVVVDIQNFSNSLTNSNIIFQCRLTIISSLTKYKCILSFQSIQVALRTFTTCSRLKDAILWPYSHQDVFHVQLNKLK